MTPSVASACESDRPLEDQLASSSMRWLACQELRRCQPQGTGCGGASASPATAPTACTRSASSRLHRRGTVGQPQERQCPASRASSRTSKHAPSNSAKRQIEIRRLTQTANALARPPAVERAVVDKAYPEVSNRCQAVEPTARRRKAVPGLRHRATPTRKKMPALADPPADSVRL